MVYDATTKKRGVMSAKMERRRRKMAKKIPTSWDDVPLVLDIPYIAFMLGLSNERVRQLLANGSIKGIKIDKIWRINKADLMSFLGANN